MAHDQRLMLAQPGAGRLALAYGCCSLLWMLAGHLLWRALEPTAGGVLAHALVADVPPLLLGAALLYRLQIRLERASAALQTILRSAKQPIALLDRQGRLQAFNAPAADGARQMFDRPFQTGEPLLASLPPANQPGWSAILVRALNGQTVRSVHTFARAHDVAWWELCVSPIRRRDGTIDGVAIIAQDITDRQRSQQHLHALINTAPIVLVALARDGLITLAQGRMFQQLRVTPDELIGRSIFELYHHRPDILADVRRALAGAEHTSTIHTAGHVFEVRWTPLREPQGEVYGALGLAIDMTERLQAETRLRELEMREQAIINGTTDAIFLKDRAGRYLLCNAATARLAGRTSAQVIGRTDAELFPPEVALHSHATDQAVLSSGQPIEVEQLLESPQGPRTLLVVKTPYLDGEGAIQGVIGIARDITERKQAEEALRQREATHRALIDALPDLIFLIDREGRYLDFKAPRGYSTLVPPAQFLGRHLRETLPPEIVGPALQHIAAAVATGEPQIFEYELPSGDRPGFYEARLVPTATGELLALVRDISDRKRAERLLRTARDVYLTLVEEAPMLVWRTDLQGTCTFVNKQWLAFTGYPRAELLPPAVADPIHPEDRAALHQAFLAARAQPRVFEIEARLRRADGIYRWMVIRSAPFFDEAGTPAGYISSAIDITERKEQERIKDDFLALASHELKTPLAAIIGYLHLLRRWLAAETTNPRVTQALNAMSSEGERLERLINDLLDVSRIQTGRLRLMPRPVDLRQLLADAAEHLRLSSASHPIQLSLPQEAPVIVQADPMRIAQVLANLVTNAVKYSPAGAPIAIELRADERQAHITVTDQGIGIPAAELEQIFERFYQVQRPARESRPGLGLGLYIARELIRQHGGTLTAHSRELAGSQFRIDLPLADATQPAAEDLTHEADDNEGLAQ
ncbi:PAS domain-containing sensor histidine kinase [Kallotenue papyrolyticum]|uniref:PAS domain-containing sensor histidine kinase n=1 Tax=Kallotenue papyrolyticum TaxID=1325125 RepID=UPI00047106F4|nr:PAS domain-containing protein [Kallotenue papyrolyticum]